MAKIAFLIYDKKLKNSRRKDNSTFDSQTNVGALMIIDALKRGGLDVGFCDEESAKNFDIVLVSFCSMYDVFNFIQVVGRHPHWRKGKRAFKSVIGGFGVQNIMPLREYVDFAFFGRAEQVIADDLKELIKDGDLNRPYVMRLHDKVHPVKVNQSTELYPHEIKAYPSNFTERETGCPRKCLFCHYAFSRKQTKNHDMSFAGAIKYSAVEMIFPDIAKQYEANPDGASYGKIKTAIDGLSERLRFAFNKRYRNDMIRDNLERLSVIWRGKLVWLDLYMIGSYPTETEADREEFPALINSLDLKGVKALIHMHVTPFRPSTLTPSQWLPADISVNWQDRAKTWKKPGTLYLARGGNIDLVMPNTCESRFSHLQSLIVERAGDDCDTIMNTIIFSKGFKVLEDDAKVKFLQDNFDLSPYLREYLFDERHPTWYLESHIPQHLVVKMGEVLKKRLGLTKEAKP